MSAKIHRPLNGIEAAQLIGRRVTEALLARPEFTGHTTFINLKFIGGVKVKGDLRKEISAKFSGTEVFDVEVAFEQVPDNPEKLRQELAPQIDPALLDVDRLDQRPGETRKGLVPLADIVGTALDRGVEERAGELQAGVYREVPISEAFPTEVATKDETSVGVAREYTNPSGPEILEELDRVPELAMEQREIQRKQLADARPHGLVPEILAEHTPETTGEPEPLDRATEPCQFCDYQVQVKGIGRSAHYRTHVKSGVAEEYEEGGIKHWRPKVAN